MAPQTDKPRLPDPQPEVIQYLILAKVYHGRLTAARNVHAAFLRQAGKTQEPLTQIES